MDNKREGRWGVMQIANKIRIYPAKEQENLLFQFAGTSRFAWNESLAFRQDRYDKDKSNTDIQQCIEHLQDLKHNHPDYNWLHSVFYQRTDHFHQIDDTHVKITGIKTPVKIKKTDIPKKVVNTRVSFDGKYWYLSYAYEIEEQISNGSGELGVDLGMKDRFPVNTKGISRAGNRSKQKILRNQNST